MMTEKVVAKKRLAVFASGGGTNFQALIDAVEEGEINAEIALCVLSNGTAYAGERALKHGIKAYVFDKETFKDEEERFLSILNLLKAYDIDYIVLAGFMTVLPEFFVKEFKGKIINIHPSLIPKYCGKGFYGMRVHKAVIEAGEEESGLTVHFVDEGIDTGEIIMQVKVPVKANDTPERLAERILQEEHTAICQAVKNLCNN